mmetsp:Transcript_12840/g.27878  ORF Transcript_12840/g.27878 Transcript_12840/m.27878 type:complete len:200 (+) Transcript_12840:413-1012(+)|eukprot:CAMPEP_0172313650 /NCGR_PEP_ID=MMETSP1058-20130122/20680_1 /TAXON_ID=83371 /ORGANISM="Detonula confervacea, Strain CCMP 353" /LENGTH=199 /DNA_ID=CAMNT_0013027341 /DNA_START=312 /DNA_END=911 /DNA_ORIENTATION=-
MTNNNRQQIQHNTRTLESRATAMAAIFMTICLLCIEHVRAFANQYHISAHDAMVLASAASSLTRKLSSVSGDSIKMIPKTASLFTSPGKASCNAASSTQLNVWSIPVIAMPSMPSMPTSKEIPIHALGSWYTRVDPTTKPPVYDDEYDSSYSFGSPTDDWPSMFPEMEESNKAVRSHMRLGPLKTIRRVAGRFKDILVQ